MTTNLEFPSPRASTGRSAVEEGQEAFRTHHNYIKSLKNLISGSSLSRKNVSRIIPSPIPCLDFKKNLIDLTKRSLKDEAHIVRTDKEYSYASTSWLPVKAYYLLFNMLLTIDYLLTADAQSFKLGHGKCAASFTSKLAAGEITFSASKLNKVYDSGIFNHREEPGANLRHPMVVDQHAMMAMKMIAKNKMKEWQRSKRIADFRSQKNGQKRNAYLQKFKLSIFDFPYHMRLRANYRDFAFIDGVSSTDTAEYFNDYYVFTVHFYKALDGLKQQLVKLRMS